MNNSNRREKQDDLKVIEKQNINNTEHKHTLICPSNSLDNVNDLDKCWKVFLAGPIQGAPNWQHSVENLFT